MAGTTGGGSVQPKLQLNAQGQPITDGSGGFLNYLQGLMKPQQSAAPAAAAMSGGGAAAAPAASTASALSGGGF